MELSSAGCVIMWDYPRKLNNIRYSGEREWDYHSGQGKTNLNLLGLSSTEGDHPAVELVYPQHNYVIINIIRLPLIKSYYPQQNEIALDRVGIHGNIG
jgi:hypothetical protein